MRALPLILLALAGCYDANAGALPKYWDAGEIWKAKDLNADFDHIHQNMYGTGHNLVSNSGVQGDAGIQLTKFKNFQLLPTAFARVTASCTGGTPGAPVTCTIGQSEGVASIKNIGLGTYQLNLSYDPLTTSIFAYPSRSGAASGERIWCYATAYATAKPQALVYCFDDAANSGDGGYSNAIFSVAVWDMNTFSY